MRFNNIWTENTVWREIVKYMVKKCWKCVSRLFWIFLHFLALFIRIYR